MARELLAHLRVDLLLDPEHLDAVLQLRQHLGQARRHVELGEQLDALVGGEVDVGGRHVGKARRILDAVEHLGRLVRDVGRERDELAGGVAHAHRQALELRVVGGGAHLVGGQHGTDEERLALACLRPRGGASGRAARR